MFVPVIALLCACLGLTDLIISAKETKNNNEKAVVILPFNRTRTASMENLNKGGHIGDLPHIIHKPLDKKAKTTVIRRGNVLNDKEKVKNHVDGTRIRRGIYAQEELNNYDEVWVGYLTIGWFLICVNFIKAYINQSFGQKRLK